MTDSETGVAPGPEGPVTQPVTERYRAFYGFQAREGQEDALEEALAMSSIAIRNDPGLIGLTLARSLLEDGLYVVISRWGSRAFLEACLENGRRVGITDRIVARCSEIKFDIFMPHDPPGTHGPVPGHLDWVLATRIMQPFPDDVDECRTLLEDRCLRIRYADGCLWAQGNVHADHPDFMMLCAAWENREAVDAILHGIGVPDAWNDPFKLKTPVTLNLFQPLLELVPDAVSAPDARSCP
jgi:quinol monooxygenase YgiN